MPRRSPLALEIRAVHIAADAAGAVDHHRLLGVSFLHRQQKKKHDGRPGAGCLLHLRHELPGGAQSRPTDVPALSTQGGSLGRAAPIRRCAAPPGMQAASAAAPPWASRGSCPAAGAVHGMQGAGCRELRPKGKQLMLQSAAGRMCCGRRGSSGYRPLAARHARRAQKALRGRQGMLSGDSPESMPGGGASGCPPTHLQRPLGALKVPGIPLVAVAHIQHQRLLPSQLGLRQHALPLGGLRRQGQGGGSCCKMARRRPADALAGCTGEGPPAA